MFFLRKRIAVAESTFEVQIIEEDSEKVWVRLDDAGALRRVWSSRAWLDREQQDAFVAQLVMRLGSSPDAAMASPMFFDGWEVWPGNPKPLLGYLSGDFPADLASTPVSRVDMDQ